MISAKVIADSVSPAGDRITTFELEYPRWIHGELMTHRVFSRNAMSSRAVPIDKMLDQVWNDPAMPVEWGKNQSGMQAKEKFELDYEIATCEFLWKQAAKAAVDQAKRLQAKGLHKQLVNRVLEPFQLMKTVVTATEWDNFFWLRCHPDAQPEIRKLADCMGSAKDQSTPEVLKTEEWHTPYVSHFRASDGDAALEYHSNNLGLSVEDALKVSASCCAQVSFRFCDDSIDKALRIYDRLVESTPVHASPFEHQATPMIEPEGDQLASLHIERGVTHMDRNLAMWSGNFKGWIQYRQLINNNVCKEYTPHAI